MHSDWDKIFNSEKYLYFYGDILTAERLKLELNFLIKYTKLNSSMKILDLACGYGRHSNALASLGHQVTGIDISKDFLDIAKREAYQSNLLVKYVQDDMRTIAYTQEFDRVFVLFTSIGYFSDDENEKVFKNVYNALKKGGVFCFDAPTIYSLLGNCDFNVLNLIKKSNNYMIDQKMLDSTSKYCLTRRTISYKGLTSYLKYKLRLYNPEEIKTILQNIGFSNLNFYKDWTGSSLGNRPKKMIVVATK